MNAKVTQRFLPLRRSWAPTREEQLLEKAMSKAEAEQASLCVLGCLCGTYSAVKSQFLTAKNAMNAKVTQRATAPVKIWKSSQ